MMQEKLAELAKRSSADKDFAVPAHSMSTKAILSPPPFCPGLSAARWPPPLHMWLAEQGFPVSAESGFRYKGYNTVDDLLRNKTLDAKELRLCGVPRRAECAHTARPPPSHLPTVHLSITVPPSNTTSLVYDPDASFWVFFCLSRSRSHQPFEVARVTGGYERSLGGPRLQAERRCRVGIECVWREEPDGTEQQALRA
jgi:hypothetical protein